MVHIFFFFFFFCRFSDQWNKTKTTSLRIILACADPNNGMEKKKCLEKKTTNQEKMRDARKRLLWHHILAMKIQIILGICAIWSGPSMAPYSSDGPRRLYKLTAKALIRLRMRSLIRAFAVRILHKSPLSVPRQIVSNESIFDICQCFHTFSFILFTSAGITSQIQKFKIHWAKPLQYYRSVLVWVGEKLVCFPFLPENTSCWLIRIVSVSLFEIRSQNVISKENVRKIFLKISCLYMALSLSVFLSHCHALLYVKNVPIHKK